MYSWDELRRLGIRGDRYTFHLVCYRELKELLERVEREFFSDFDRSRKAGLVNNFLTVLEPYLLYHLEMGLTLDFDKVNKPPHREDEEGPVLMDEHLYLDLDIYNYRLLKRFHGLGPGGSCPSGTFSMALVVRSLLWLALHLIGCLGRDGFLQWVAEWEKSVGVSKEGSPGGAWDLFKHYMLFLKVSKVQNIHRYSRNYPNFHPNHPPPDQ